MNKLLFFGIVLASFAIMLVSCQYKSLVEPVIPPPDPEDTISFSLQIAPIWSDAGCTDCHSGGQSPDLRADKAFNSITSAGLVDTATPEESRIYFYPLPDGNHYVTYNSSQAVMILGWIEQGAKNN